VNRGIFSARTADPFQTVELFDIAGVSLSLGENLMPPYIVEGRGVDMAALLARYQPYGSMPLVWPPGHKALIASTRDQADLDTLRSVWLSAIRRCPGCYARHRLRFVEALLGFADRPPVYQYQFVSDID